MSSPDAPSATLASLVDRMAQWERLPVTEVPAQLRGWLLDELRRIAEEATTLPDSPARNSVIGTTSSILSVLVTALLSCSTTHANAEYYNTLSWSSPSYDQDDGLVLAPTRPGAPSLASGPAPGGPCPGRAPRPRRQGSATSH